MTKVLVCQHVAHESLGTIENVFKDQGVRVRYANFGRHPNLKTSLKGYDGLVILGGPMNVDQTVAHPYLLHEMELIREGLEKQIPILGICLGAQLIAKTLGARVFDNAKKEIGWHDVTLTKEGKSDPFFKNFTETEHLFHWHGQTFEIPPGAVHLARSHLCANQAFRYGSKVYGLQFHLEVDEGIINRWLTIESNQDELELLKGEVDPGEIRLETPASILRLTELSRLSFAQFIGLLERKRKFIRLPWR